MHVRHVSFWSLQYVSLVPRLSPESLGTRLKVYRVGHLGLWEPSVYSLGRMGHVAYWVYMVCVMWLIECVGYILSV